MRSRPQGCCRQAVESPGVLLDQVSVLIEEGLYSQGFALLTSTLTAGHGTVRPALVPPPVFFALAATLAVHPAMTTKTRNHDKHVAADNTIRYLRLAERVVGTQGADLHEAFRFIKSEDLRAQRARFRKSTDLDERPVEKLQCIYLKQNIFDRAEDFWQVLGWALNCSIIEPKRWKRWHLLLSVMLDALENDLQQVVLDSKSDDRESSQLPVAALDDTLLAKYLKNAGGLQNKRRVMRAVLADGTAKSLAEFGEIWEKETDDPKEVVDQDKRPKLDLDKDQYGDYDENSDEELTRTLPSLDPGRRIEPTNTAFDFSNTEATAVRQRVLVLLAKLCAAEPAAYITTSELFDLYGEFLRPLPLRHFQNLAMVPARLLDEDSQSSFYQLLLRSSIDSSAPVYDRNDLTQNDFESYFAPYAANSPNLAENAKVSLLIEGMLRLLWKHDMLDRTDKLETIVLRGIQARTAHATGTDEYESECLRLSGERMLAVLQRLQGNV